MIYVANSGNGVRVNIVLKYEYTVVRIDYFSYKKQIK